MRGEMAIPTSPHQQSRRAETGSSCRCGVPFRRKLPAPAQPSVARARAAEIGSGLRAIGNKPSWILLQERNSKRKLPNKKKKKERAHAISQKGKQRGREERSVRRHAGASRLPPPLLVFAIATTPRLGTIRLRARESALHRGAQADRAGVLVGE